MHSWRQTLLAASAVCVIGAAPAVAIPGNNGGGNGGCGVGQQTNGCGSAGAPGPIAGAGLPFLLMAGGYALVRRYRNRRVAE